MTLNTPSSVMHGKFTIEPPNSVIFPAMSSKFSTVKETWEQPCLFDE